MATERQRQKANDSQRAYRLSVINTCISALALFLSAGGLWWQAHQSGKQRINYDKHFGAIDTSLRLLTATVAPQLLKAVDDSLVSVLLNNTVDPTSAFSDVESKTTSLRMLGAKLPSAQLEQSSLQLRKALEKYPENISAWGAAAQMVSLRSYVRTAVSSQPDCFSSQIGERAISVVEYHDCTLNLDDVERYNELYTMTTQPQPDNKLTPFKGVLAASITLRNGTVHYSGGKIIGMRRLTCDHCIFDFAPPANIPPPQGRNLSEQLLTADLSNVSLDLTHT